MVVLTAMLLAASGATPVSDPGRPFTYVALGDSLGAGAGAQHGGYVDRLYDRLHAELPRAVLRNLSANGATTQDVLRYQLPRLAALRPSLITLSVGTNDVTGRTPTVELARNLREIMTAARATGAAVIVTNLPAVALAPAVPIFLRPEIDEQVQLANQTLQGVCAQVGVALFDLYTLSRAELPRHPEYFSRDGFHPSDDGYDWWAKAMWPDVKRALPRL